MCRSALAELMRVDWRAVGGICARVGASLEEADGRGRFDGPRSIGVDETGYEKGRKYMTVVVDHDRGRAVWACAGHGKRQLNAFLDLLKEGLRAVFRAGPERAAGELDRWLARACRRRIPEFVELSRKVRRKRDGILRSIALGASNARVEAVNNKIKVAIRQGYGFRNTDDPIALIMLRCSVLRPALPGRTAS